MVEIFDMQRLSLEFGGRTKTINRRTKRMLDIVEGTIQRKLFIVKGSYLNESGSGVSAKTHNGGGTVDIRTFDQGGAAQVKETVLELRRIGFAAWHRTPENSGFDHHIHAVAIGDPELHQQAANQVTAYENGRNGLAGAREGPDPGPRLEPLPPVFPILKVKPPPQIAPPRRVPEMILVRQQLEDQPDRIWLLSATNRRHVRESSAFRTLEAVGIPFDPDAAITSELLQSFPEGDPITGV
jgi:hypothetical protein